MRGLGIGKEEASSVEDRELGFSIVLGLGLERSWIGAINVRRCNGGDQSVCLFFFIFVCLLLLLLLRRLHSSSHVLPFGTRIGFGLSEGYVNGVVLGWVMIH